MLSDGSGGGVGGSSPELCDLTNSPPSSPAMKIRKSRRRRLKKLKPEAPKDKVDAPKQTKEQLVESTTEEEEHESAFPDSGPPCLSSPQLVLPAERVLSSGGPVIPPWKQQQQRKEGGSFPVQLSPKKPVPAARDASAAETVRQRAKPHRTKTTRGKSKPLFSKRKHSKATDATHESAPSSKQRKTSNGVKPIGARGSNRTKNGSRSDHGTDTLLLGVPPTISKRPGTGGDASNSDQVTAKKRNFDWKNWSARHSASSSSSQTSQPSSESSSCTTPSSAHASLALSSGKVSRNIWHPSKVENGSLASKKPPSQLWVDKYAPTTVAELCVHHNKVKAVREWLQGNYSKLNTYPSNFHQKVLLLTGPAGSAKSAMIRALCRELGLEIVSWTDEPDSGPDYGSLSSAPPRESRISVFRRFFMRVNRYPKLSFASSSTSSGGRAGAARDGAAKVVLVEEFPVTFGEGEDWRGSGRQAEKKAEWLALVKQVTRSSRFLIIFIVTSHHETSSDLDRLFDGELLSSPLVGEIKCNPVADSLLRKGLQRVLRREDRHASDALLQSLVDSSKGDLRSAIQNLQFHLIGQEFRPPGGKQQAKGKGKRKKHSAKRKSSRSSSSLSEESDAKGDAGSTATGQVTGISARDETYSIFRSLGRILHAKTLAVEQVVERGLFPPALFVEFLHQNYLDHLGGGVAEAAECLEGFSDADLLTEGAKAKYGNSGGASPDMLAASTACRAFLCVKQQWQNSQLSGGPSSSSSSTSSSSFPSHRVGKSTLHGPLSTKARQLRDTAVRAAQNLFLHQLPVAPLPQSPRVSTAALNLPGGVDPRLMQPLWTPFATSSPLFLELLPYLALLTRPAPPPPFRAQPNGLVRNSASSSLGQLHRHHLQRCLPPTHRSWLASLCSSFPPKHAFCDTLLKHRRMQAAQPQSRGGGWRAGGFQAAQPRRDNQREVRFGEAGSAPADAGLDGQLLSDDDIDEIQD